MILDITKIHQEFLEDRENFTYENLPDLFPKNKKGFYMWCSQFEEYRQLAYNAGYISHFEMYGM